MWTALALAVWVVAVSRPADGARSIPTFAGRWNAWAEQLDSCSDEDKRVRVRFSHYNPNKKFQHQRWTGIMNVTKAVDDSWWARARLDVRNNNQWKENAFVFDFPNKACSGGREHLPEVFLQFFTKKGTPCVMFEAEHVFENQTVDITTFRHFPILPYGHFRFWMSAGPQNVKEAEYCIYANCHTIPKGV